MYGIGRGCVEGEAQAAGSDAQVAPAPQRHHMGRYHAGQILQVDPRWHYHGCGCDGR